MRPLVSIIIPVYNGSNYLAKAIDSALNQTYSNIEIIVVNDGSKDEGATERIALSYEDKIKYYYKENGGVSSALNYGIEKMKGEYFSWLSHDDIYLPEKIEKQIEVIEKYNQDNLIVMCNTGFIDKDGNKINKRIKKIACKKYDSVAMFLNIFRGFLINGCSLLIPKKMFNIVGMFNVDLRYMQDMELWYRALFKEYFFVYTDDVCCLSRIHQNQVTITMSHLGKRDAVIVGTFLVNNFLANIERFNAPIKQYMLLCYKRGNFTVADLAYNSLRSEGKINASLSIKKCVCKISGKVRPFLKKVYYKLILK